MYENYGWKYLVTAAVTLLFGFALAWSPISLGIDLKGGSEMLYRLDTTRLPAGTKSDLTDTTIQVLQNRLDALAIKELSIRKQGSWDIVIQVPGASETEVQQIKATVSTTGLLDFKLVVTSAQLGSEAEVDANIRDVLQRKADGKWQAYVSDDQPSDRFDVATDKQTGRPVLLENQGVSGRYLKDAYRSQDQAYRPAVGFSWNSTGRNKFYDMTSKNVGRQMAIVLDGIAQSAPVIRSAISDSGIIEGGSGGFSEEEVKRLIVILKAGALPAKPVFQYEQKVGATLGQAAVKWGGIATVLSMLLVLTFMIFYYKAGGVIANVALVLNILLLMGNLAMFGATLTLPGIAGILLTAGMAVDANILIFERMREESARGAEIKQAISLAYDRAFWTIFDSHVTTLVTGFVLYWTGTGPIRGFAVTLIIGISISLFTSLFVTKAIYGWLGAKGKLPTINFRHLIKNTNFDFMGFYPKAVTGSLILINVGFLVFLLRGNEKYGIDFTGGTVLQMRLKAPLEKSEVDKRIEELGIREYDTQRVGERVEGGTDRGFEFTITTRKLAEQLGLKKGETKKVSLSAPSLLSPAYGQDPAPVTSPAVGGQAPVSTQTAPAPVAPVASEAPASQPLAAESNADEVQDQNLFRTKITEKFRDDLVIAFPDTPGHLASANYAVEPVADGQHARVKFRVNVVPAPSYSGELEAAVVRDSAKAALTALASNPVAPRNNDESLRRATATEVAADLDGKELAKLEGRVKTFEVTTGPIGNSPDVEKRAYEVAVGAFDRNATCTIADPFPRVDQIGGAVAKNLKTKAFVSMFFAIIAIVIYVAFRFEFIWGIGAILSLVHDLFTTMGFMAILDLIFSKLHIDFDCKINLPTVAAFLTLLGYSIADTIVVYDRIRERVKLNKLKHADAHSINEAINGTLSRTILTSLTVFFVAVVLFGCSFADLKVIQGFSVAMCFGVVTGTYSSIFIAAPVILSDLKKLRTLLVGETIFIVAALVISRFL
jgi:protein-export membrane protein SecD/preprotein translocase SecF subunit